MNPIMKPPATIPPPDAKPSRAGRRWLIAGIVLALLVPGFYWFENWSGRVALEKVVAEYEAAGLSLDPASFLPGPVPAEENFGATPLLDGIMHEDRSASGWAAQKKRKTLQALPWCSNNAYGWSSFLDKAWASIHEQDPVWKSLRAGLKAHKLIVPPADEPSDVRAVYAALEVHRLSFDELAIAAKRPHALFTPAARDRIELWRQASPAFPTNEMMALARLVLIRARAGVALGQIEEAMSLTAVLWKLRGAWLAEATERAYWLSCNTGRFWQGSVRTVLRSADINDAHLAGLLATCGADWSPEQELRHTFQGEASYHLIAVQGSRADVFRRPRWGFSRFQENMLGYGPSGWVEQNLSKGLRETLHYILLPLTQHGFAALPAAGRELDAIHGDAKAWSPYRFLCALESSELLLHVLVMHAQQIRLTLLAIGMERYRLRHGRYPADAAALVPDCIAAIPPDMDGAPLRIVTSPDGATCVLYSIGWNLTDDWHGIIPASYTAAEEMKNADWPLALPFPPLPPP